MQRARLGMLTPSSNTVLEPVTGDGASLAEDLERELGIPVYDSIALALWGSLRLAKVAPSRVRGWGRLFHDVP